jgi:hypothetical protein
VIRRPGSRLLQLPALLAALAVAASHASGADATALAIWQDNITNTTTAGGRLPSWMLSVMASDEVRRILPDDNAFFLGASFEGEACMDYHGLNFASAGPTVGIQHKFGLGAYVPTLRLDLGVEGIAAAESARAGWSDRATLNLGQRFTEALRLDLTGEWNRTDARDDTFSHTATVLGAALAFDLNDRWRLKAGVRWRNGDVVSYYRAQWTAWGWVPSGYGGYDGEYGDQAGRLVTTFDRPYLAYRLNADTLSYAVTLSPALGPNTALVFTGECSVTENNSVRYVNHLISAGVTHRF